MNEVTCRDIKDDLLEYLEGELPAEQRMRFSSHISGCLNCRKEATDTESVLRNLSRDELPDPGDDFWRRFQANIRESIDREERPQRNILVKTPGRWGLTGWYRRWVPAFSMAVVFFAIGVFLYQWVFTGSPVKLSGLKDREPVLNEETLNTMGPEVEFVVESLEDNGIYFELSQLNTDEIDELYGILQQKGTEGFI